MRACVCVSGCVCVPCTLCTAVCRCVLHLAGARAVRVPWQRVDGLLAWLRIPGRAIQRRLRHAAWAGYRDGATVGCVHAGVDQGDGADGLWHVHAQDHHEVNAAPQTWRGRSRGCCLSACATCSVLARGARRTHAALFNSAGTVIVQTNPTTAERTRQSFLVPRGAARDCSTVAMWGG